MARDLRRYAHQTNLGLIIGFVSILLIVGEGLIYLFYGKSAAIMGLICILASLVPVIMIIAALRIIETIVKATNKD
jgi:hypothetical protein